MLRFRDASLTSSLSQCSATSCRQQQYKRQQESSYRVAASSAKHLTELHIGGIFPMEAGSGGWPGGQACLPAVQMALDDINQNEEVLAGYRLVLHHYNSKCQPGLAAQQMYELLYKKPVKLMLLAGCSPVTTVVAEAAPVWNLVVLSYGASSPALSNRYRFPTLFRTHPSANMQNPTRIKLFEKFRWRRITILQSVEEVFVSTARDLEEQCRDRGIRVERQSFYGDPTDAVKALVRQDARIIVGLFYVTEARRVLCQAYKHGLYGRKYVWFFIGWYADTWYIPPKDEMINCTEKQMEEAAEYHFTTESIMLSRDKNPAISGMTGLQFQSRLTDMIDTDPANTGGFPEAPLAYDAVWALALAFNCTMSALPENSRLEEFAYNDTVIANQLFECVKNTQFKGVSGQVMFSDSGDRIARTQIEQMQNGKYVVLGYYDTTSQRLDWVDKELFFGGKGPPPDATIIKESVLTVSRHLYIGVFVLVVICLFMAVAAFAFNAYYLGRSIVRESQPQCNNVLVVGCALCSLSLVLMGLPAEGVTFPRQSFSLLCHSRISILMIGFTFAYGSMFAKVWIVHRMGANENHELAAYQKDEPIAACKFYIVIACLFVVDVVIILAWIIFDPLRREEQRFHLQDPSDVDDDVMLLPILELCQSKHQEVWIGLILGEKCLLLVFGLFLAYESRKFKMKFVNDSRFVGMAIYNVAILSLVTGPIVTLIIRSQADANFAFVSFTVLLCTYMSLGLVFVPKMLHVYRVPYVKDDNTATVGQHLLATLTPSEQKRYDQLLAENTDLKRQIDLKERKISECRQQLEKRLKDVNLMNGFGEFANNNNSSRISEDDNPTYSSPTTLTTTALIEVQPTETGQESDFDEDSSSCSSEILL
uniref:G_PROTEIN_RECEP_F3_4 domain-containing protein n=1 Tax=Steinernema glaseri TaxID=37863 RepID=A0A1I7ZV87_9BILA